MRLHIGNLASTTTSDELMEMSRPFGNVKSAEIITERASGTSRGYGFVVFDTDAAVAAAKAGLQGKDVNGRALRVG